MSGLTRFIGKELLEIVRTWRIWVLPGLLLFMALTSPVLAKSTPAMLQSFVEDQPGVTITVPEPTYLDSYGQWVKNLQQMVLIALLLTSAGLIAGERTSGTAILVLTKPLSRPAFVIAKFLVQCGLLIVATVVGAAVCWAATLAVFGEAPPERLITSTAAWLAFAVLLTAVMVALSARLNALAAGGVGIIAFFAMSILTLWAPAVRYSPAGLVGASSKLLAGEAAQLGWPLATGALSVVVLLAAGVVLFERAEL